MQLDLFRSDIEDRIKNMDTNITFEVGVINDLELRLTESRAMLERLSAKRVQYAAVLENIAQLEDLT